MRRDVKYYRLNYQIKAPTIRLLDDTGKQIGVVLRDDALRKAQEEEKDLVEIAPNARPPVVKLIDFKKFKYLEAKKERESRRNAKNVGVKEIRLSPFMGAHDFDTRVAQGEEFLSDGNQLKIALPFKGRAIVHKEFGMQVMTRALERLSPHSRVVKSAHFEGRVLTATLVPFKHASVKPKEEHAKNEDKKITA